ncbi:hypothetical protein A8H39_40380 [Paraburkholderia fungorum]|nr:hypothetical protein A8H39_40380 [Paraburkholderia fungorum]
MAATELRFILPVVLVPRFAVASLIRDVVLLSRLPPFHDLPLLRCCSYNRGSDRDRTAKSVAQTSSMK